LTNSNSPSRDQPILTSILDRLLDDEPQNNQPEPPKHHHQLLRDLRLSVRRDLENLLNTRRRCTALPSDLTQLEVSLVNYGIPDFCAENVGGEDPEELLRDIQLTIQRFEPRLKKVRVAEIENEQGQGIDRTLRFRIHAILCVNRIQDPVSFDSALEIATGDFRVETNK